MTVRLGGCPRLADRMRRIGLRASRTRRRPRGVHAVAAIDVIQIRGRANSLGAVARCGTSVQMRRRRSAVREALRYGGSVVCTVRESCLPRRERRHERWGASSSVRPGRSAPRKLRADGERAPSPPPKVARRSPDSAGGPALGDPLGGPLDASPLLTAARDRCAGGGKLDTTVSGSTIRGLATVRPARCTQSRLELPQRPQVALRLPRADVRASSPAVSANSSSRASTPHRPRSTFTRYNAHDPHDDGRRSRHPRQGRS
jgi:hypothetical protein